MQNVKVYFGNVTSSIRVAYEFKSFIDLKVNDYVVVECANGYQVARVCEINTSGERATAWVVCKVDMREYIERKEKAEKYEQKMREIARRYKQVDKMSLYKRAAETDEVLAQLLADLEELK